MMELALDGPGGPRSCRWGDVEVEILLYCYEQHLLATPGQQRPLVPLLKTVATQLWKLGYQKTWVQIRDKLHNMRREFKAMRAKGLTDEEGLEQWKYFTRFGELDALFRRASLAPPLVPAAEQRTLPSPFTVSVGRGDRYSSAGEDVFFNSDFEENRNVAQMDIDGSRKAKVSAAMRIAAVNSSSSSAGRSRVTSLWSHQETVVLLCFLKEYCLENIKLPKKDRKPTEVLVKEILHKLSKLGFAKTPSQIRDKWHNMKKRYYGMKSMRKSDEECMSEWMYFKEVSQLVTGDFILQSSFQLTENTRSNVSASGHDPEVLGDTPPESTRTGSNASSASADCVAAANAKAGNENTAGHDEGVHGVPSAWDAAGAVLANGEVSFCKEGFLDMCRQQMEFMQTSNTQHLSWCKAQMEQNQQNFAQQQAWFQEQILLQRQREEDLLQRQFEETKSMTESIIFRLFDGMCQLVDGLANKNPNVQIQPSIRRPPPPPPQLIQNKSTPKCSGNTMSNLLSDLSVVETMNSLVSNDESSSCVFPITTPYSFSESQNSIGNV